MLASVFVSSKPFWGKVRAYPRVAPFTLGMHLALPTNIRLGWKGLPETS